jgi:hypothetical protein
MGEPNAPERRKSFDETIEDILLYLELPKWRPLVHGAKQDLLPISYFTNSLPLVDFYDGGLHRGLEILSDVLPTDVSGRLDVCALRLPLPEDQIAGKEPIRYEVYRMRQRDLKDVRGRVKPVSPLVVEVAYARVDQQGGYITNRHYVGYVPKGERWVAVDTLMGRQILGSYEADVHLMMRCAYGLMFRAYYDWHVTIGLDDGPTLKLPTDPTGVREVFRLRDIPPGRQRRTALHHWVREHWRQRRADPTTEAKVREYLRGATKFTWNGLRCTIAVIDEDQQKERQLVAQRLAEGSVVRSRREGGRHAQP